MPYEFRINEITFVQLTVKLHSLLYVHHPGQFFMIDSDAKVPILMKETTYLNTQHDVVYSRPTIGYRGLSCDPAMDRFFDLCIKISVDELFQNYLNCSYPLLTSIENQTDKCDFGKFSDTKMNIFNTKLKGIQIYKF